VRQWRRRYPNPVPWVDDRANKACRRSEREWLARFEGLETLRRREVYALALWRLGGSAERMERAVEGITGPAEWGHARRSIKRALAATSPMTALEHLTGEQGIPGWGPVMASTVLAACRPAVFAVGDERTLRTLAALGLVDPTDPDEFGHAEWWPYLRASRHLSEVSGVPLRGVWQALWAAADDAPGLPGPVGRPVSRPPSPSPAG